MTGVELTGCALALSGSVVVLSMLDRDDGLFRAWLVFLLALALASVAMLAAAVNLGVEVVAALRIASNVLWAGSAVRFAMQLARAGLGGPLEGRWRWLTYGVAAGTFALVGMWLWLGAEPSGNLAWRLRRLIGILADAVVLNACVQVLRFTWPMRRGRVSRPYVFFILAALTFIARGLLQNVGVPAFVDIVAASVAWGAVVLAPWQQAQLTRSLMRG